MMMETERWKRREEEGRKEWKRRRKGQKTRKEKGRFESNEEVR